MFKIILISIVFSIIINYSYVDADCCPALSWQPAFSCNGVGSCNIFCCNCDGGCRPDCINIY